MEDGSPLSPPMFRYIEDGKEVKREGSTMCTPFKGHMRFFVSLKIFTKMNQQGKVGLYLARC